VLSFLCISLMLPDSRLHSRQIVFPCVTQVGAYLKHNSQLCGSPPDRGTIVCFLHQLLASEHPSTVQQTVAHVPSTTIRFHELLHSKPCVDKRHTHNTADNHRCYSITEIKSLINFHFSCLGRHQCSHSRNGLN